MSHKTLTGIPVIFGTPKEIKNKFKNQPEGKIRLRFRNDDFARAYVKTKYVITEHYVLEIGAHWELSQPIRANCKLTPTT
jgi:hypothetical protein